LWRLTLPYLAIGFLSSLGLFALNELWVPRSADAAEQIRIRHTPPDPNSPGRDKVLNAVVMNSRAHRLWHIGIYDTKTGAMTRPQVISTAPNGAETILDADRAAYLHGIWTFYAARVRRDVHGFKLVVLETNVLAKPDFYETPAQINSDIRISASLNTLSLKGAKKADLPVREILDYLRLNPHPPQGAALLYTKLNGRLAAPWTCLVVVLIAIPFGAASGRRNVFVGVASSLAIFLIYYGLQLICPAIGASDLIKTSWAPWVMAWFPNLAFGVTGLWLTARVR
jgi:lipopolysaccharide export system permease protein